MKITLAALALAALAGNAQAKPWNGADCVATAEKDLQGATLAAMHTDDAGKTTNALSFEPKSFFVADGYAVKLFDAENFTGAGELDGDALNLSSLTKTDGGHYINVGSAYISTAKSFACVPAGKVWPEAKAFHEHFGGSDKAVPVLYFPGQVFYGDQGYHGQYGSIALDDKDGRKILTFETSFYYAKGARGTIDLDSGAITYSVIGGAWPHDVLTTQVINQDHSVKGIDFQYKGALDSVLTIIDLVIANQTTISPAGNAIKVPNLELKPLRSLLLNGIYRD